MGVVRCGIVGLVQRGILGFVRRDVFGSTIAVGGDRRVPYNQPADGNDVAGAPADDLEPGPFESTLDPGALPFVTLGAFQGPDPRPEPALLFDQHQLQRERARSEGAANIYANLCKLADAAESARSHVDGLAARQGLQQARRGEQGRHGQGS